MGVQSLKQKRTLRKRVPVNRESPFSFEELFFSITDPKSVITAANQTFVRISKFTKPELMGELHNIIRHPDMPRAVFKVFWDYIETGKPIAAYVKNMAKDGSFYWVMTLAFPAEGGYMSIRLKPGSPTFQVAEELYKDVLELEKKIEKETNQRQAIQDTERYLISRLKALGFSNYTEFMRSALQDEMVYREQKMKKLGVRKHPEKELYPVELSELNSLLSRLVLTSENLREMHKALSGYSDYTLKLSKSILLLSLNAQVGSEKMNNQENSLSVVAENMVQQTLDGEQSILTIKKQLNTFSNSIGDLNFEVISAKLQAEMTMDFLQEINGNETNDYSSELGHLDQAFWPRIPDICNGVKEMTRFYGYLSDWIAEIERFLMVLRFIHISGEIEVARMNEKAGSFHNTFNQLLTEIRNADAQMDELQDEIIRNERIFKDFRSYRKALSRIRSRKEQRELVSQ